MMFFRYLVFFLFLVGFVVDPVSRSMAWEEEERQVRDTKAEWLPTKTAVAKFKVDFRVAIKAPAKTKQLRIWVPLPPSNENQSVWDRKLQTFPRPHQPQITREPNFGNEFAYFEINEPDGPLEIQHTFTAEIAQLDWGVDYSKIINADSWPRSFEVFQTPDVRSERAKDYTEIVKQIQSVSDQKSKQFMKAIKWVDENLTYDSSNASLTADPAHGLIHRRGHCSDYHGLCGTFAREIGYPSRVLYGLQMFDKGSPSHCKLEVFMPPYGWVSYDLSETQKLAFKVGKDDKLLPEQREKTAEFVRQRTLNGFRENTWLLVTRGENYPLTPNASNPVSIIRTIYAEADGIPLEEGAAAEAGTWLTMQRVEEVGDKSRRFTELKSQH
ncbi:MAG: transglutaminase [Rhodopirellula sp.]|nr:transglutaminase [Rhodopirellula sp.]